MRKIKIIFLLSVLTMVVSPAFAQGVTEALLFSQRNHIGNARTLAMGNAFTAVGGDLSAVSVNPASAGVLKTGEFDITGGVYNAISSSSYLNNAGSASVSQFGLPSVSCEFVTPTMNRSGLKSISFGMSINRVASFNTSMSASGMMSMDNVNALSSWMAAQTSGIMGVPWETMKNLSYNNTTIPWRAMLGYDTGMIQPWGYYGDGYYLATTENVIKGSMGLPYAVVNAPFRQSFSRNTFGGNDEIALNIAGNYADFFYWGINMDIYNLRYSSEEVYQESAMDVSYFDTGFDYFRHTYSQTTSGAGIGFKFGAIVLPTENLRLGVTVTTPTWYNISDNWYESMRGRVSTSADSYKETPLGAYTYKLKSPMRVSAGMAYTFGRFGLLSVDWEMTDYRNIRLSSASRLENIFAEENNYMSSQFLLAHVVRAGLEINVLPGISLRGGYNYYFPVSTNSGYRKDEHYYSAGLGFRLSERVCLDLAYQGQTALAQNFTLYSDYDGIKAPVGVMQARQNKFLFTFRFKL